MKISIKILFELTKNILLILFAISTKKICIARLISFNCSFVNHFLKIVVMKSLFYTAKENLHFVSVIKLKRQYHYALLSCFLCTLQYLWDNFLYLICKQHIYHVLRAFTGFKLLPVLKSRLRGTNMCKNYFCSNNNKNLNMFMSHDFTVIFDNRKDCKTKHK